MADYLELLRRMLVIRYFEERVNVLFAAGELKGTSHLAVGQEATAVGAGDALLNSIVHAGDSFNWFIE